MVINLASPRAAIVVSPDGYSTGLVVLLTRAPNCNPSMWGNLQRLDAPVQELYVQPIGDVSGALAYPITPYEKATDGESAHWDFEAHSSCELVEGSNLRKSFKLVLSQVESIGWVITVHAISTHNEVISVLAELFLPGYNPKGDYPLVLEPEPDPDEYNVWNFLENPII